MKRTLYKTPTIEIGRYHKMTRKSLDQAIEKKGDKSLLRKHMRRTMGMKREIDDILSSRNQVQRYDQTQKTQGRKEGQYRNVKTGIVFKEQGGHKGIVVVGSENSFLKTSQSPDE